MHRPLPESMRLLHRTCPRRATSSGPRNGFTVLEIAIALIVVAVALGGLVASSFSTYQLSRSNQARSAAHVAAREVVEALRSADPAQVFALYNADEDDDPDGVGTAPGMHFAVEGLTARSDDADGFVGRVVFPVDGGGVLRETVVNPALDMPRDLNLDGVQDGDDRSADYALLPVSVELDWTGAKSNGHYEVHLMLMAIR